MFGKGVDGKWLLLADAATSQPRPDEDLRKATIRNLKQAGFEYIVTPVDGATGNGPLGKYLFDHAAEWGIIDIAGVDTIRLLKL
jgi:hypothetical protein